MKPIQVILALVWLMLLAGLALWVTSGDGLPIASAMLWIAAFMILCTPLLLWAVHAMLRGWKDR
jgi:hypothetical protein